MPLINSSGGAAILNMQRSLSAPATPLRKSVTFGGGGSNRIYDNVDNLMDRIDNELATVKPERVVVRATEVRAITDRQGLHLLRRGACIYQIGLLTTSEIKKRILKSNNENLGAALAL